MKIEIDIDENKILELAKSSSMNELPNSILYEVKRQAIELAVKEIKDKLVSTPYYGGKEILFEEVGDYLYKQLNTSIQRQIELKFSDKSIESIVSSKVERVIGDWIEKKVYERLTEIKADINFYSEKELKEEADARQEE